MGENSKIEWTQHTFNAVWGCVKVSPGCQNCYAEGLAHRYGHNIWGPAKTTSRRTFGEKHWQEPLKWNKKAAAAGRRATVFCGSMSDIGEHHPDWVSERVKLVKLITKTPNLIWLLLTKRPEDFMRLFDAACLEGLGITCAEWLALMGDRVWVGTSVEDQAAADKRIPHLLTIPAAIRFLSVEPLLGPVDLWGARYKMPDGEFRGALTTWAGPSIQWVIVGGESGPYARPMAKAWVDYLRLQCEMAGVAFFFKQWGEWEEGKSFDEPLYKGGKGLYFERAGHSVAYENVTGGGSHVYTGQHGKMFFKTGKKANGRVLNGQTYSEFPKINWSSPVIKGQPKERV